MGIGHEPQGAWQMPNKHNIAAGGDFAREWWTYEGGDGGAGCKLIGAASVERATNICMANIVFLFLDNRFLTICS
jgi:hypothetical protein